MVILVIDKPAKFYNLNRFLSSIHILLLWNFVHSCSFLSFLFLCHSFYFFTFIASFLFSFQSILRPATIPSRCTSQSPWKINNKNIINEIASSKKHAQFQQQIEKLNDLFEQRLQQFINDAANKHQMEMDEIDERKTNQIVKLIEKHENAFTDMQTYYDDIVKSNLELIENLKKQMQALAEQLEKSEQRLKKVRAFIAIKMVLVDEESGRVYCKWKHRTRGSIGWEVEAKCKGYQANNTVCIHKMPQKHTHTHTDTPFNEKASN